MKNQEEEVKNQYENIPAAMGYVQEARNQNRAWSDIDSGMKNVFNLSLDDLLFVRKNAEEMCSTASMSYLKEKLTTGANLNLQEAMPPLGQLIGYRQKLCQDILKWPSESKENKMGMNMLMLVNTKIRLILAI